MADSTSLLLDALKEYEGERKQGNEHVAYQDSAGIWTIGYGHTGNVQPGDKISQEEADRLLLGDTQAATDAVDKLVTYQMNPSQRAAVTSLVFNVGAGAFSRSKALQHLNAGNLEGFQTEAFDAEVGFTKATIDGKKKKLDGLVNRRAKERGLFNKTPAAFIDQPKAADYDPTFGAATIKPDIPAPTVEAPHDPTFGAGTFDPADVELPNLSFELSPEAAQHAEDTALPAPEPRRQSPYPPGWFEKNTQPIGLAPLDEELPVQQVSLKEDPQFPSQLTEEQVGVKEALGLDSAPEPIKIERPLSRTAYTALDAAADQLRAEQTDKPSLWEITKAAGRQDNTLGSLFAQEREFPLDPNFVVKDWTKTDGIKDRFTALEQQGADIEEMYTLIGEATSEDMAMSRLKELEKDAADEALFMQAGMKALLPRVLVALADPVDIGITVATLPISGGASSALKFGQLGRIATGALTAATATGSTEAVLAANSVFRDETDVAFATLAGFTLGGGITALTGREARRLQSILDDVAEGEIDSAARKMGIDDAGAQRVRHSSDGEPNKNLAGKVADDVDEVLAEIEDPKFGYKWMSTLMANFQKHTFFAQSERVRKLSSGMLEGGFLKNRGVRRMTAEGRANLVRRTFETGIFRESLPHFNAWAKRLGHGKGRQLFTTSTGEEFYSEVGRAMRGMTEGLSPEAVAAAAKMRPYMDNIYELAERAGVEGFSKEALEDYFPRMINQNQFSKMIREVGAEGMNKWYREAIISANDDIPEAIADKIARNYVRVMTNKTNGIQTDLLHGIRLDDTAKLREIFHDDPNIDELIGEIESLKLKETGERGTVEFSKRRIRFDEMFEAPVTKFDGTSVMLKFDELLENDARKVLKRYGQIMSGHIGMAQELGIKSRAQFDDFTATIAGEVDELGLDRAQMKREVSALNDAYNLILGQSIEAAPDGSASKLSRMATGFTYSTRGGQFGVNALAEAGNIIGAAGIRAFLRSIPEWKSMITRAADGTLDHDLARTAELLFAPGIHTLTGHAVRNLDELGEGFEAGVSTLDRAARASDPYLKSAGRFTSIASGLSGITDLTQRIAGTEFLRKLARFSAKAPGGKQAERLRALGLNDAMQERIFKMMRPEAEGGAGVYRKGRLVDLNVEKWSDADALDAMNMAANREVRQVIQENDISNVTSAFHHPVGRIVFQFLRFPMEAMNKQLLRGIHHRDAEAAMSWMSSLFIGATVYAAQTSIEYANDDEERKERLSAENIAKVGFMRTGFSSMVPVAVDVLGHPLGLDPQFAKGRSSGLGTNVITGNPVVRAGVAAYQGASAISRSLLSDEVQFAQQDVRNIASLIPGHRLLGVKNAIHAIEQQFPESRDQ